ncbi:MAG: copper chaperone PCu(A)C [Zetaproteobacteria bacterium]|nr:MAG: copper chaperone PCu(A)C [Zetaproteobacteria bacterium]
MKRWLWGWSFVMLASTAHAAGLVIVDAWIPEAPPQPPIAAGYATLENRTDAPIRIEAAHCEGAKRTMLHETKHSRGQAQMVEAEAWIVPAHGKLKLAPGGRHLMLMHLTHPLRAGDRVRCTLKTDRGAVEGTWQVRRR